MTGNYRIIVRGDIYDDIYEGARQRQQQDRLRRYPQRRRARPGPRRPDRGDARVW